MSTDRVAFVTPTTVADAVGEMAAGTATVLAGGTSVALLIGQNLLAPSKLLCVTRIPELRSIDFDAARGEVRIGAAVTLRELATSQEIRTAFPSLVAAARAVGNPRVRSVATVGGAVAHSDPRQDLPPVLLSLDARVSLSGPRGSREVPLSGFATGFMETNLRPDELVTGIVLPLVGGRRSHYARFTPQSVADYPTVGVAASVTCDDAGMIIDARVAIAGVASTALEVADASLLVGAASEADDIEDVVGEVARLAGNDGEPIDDRLGSARYKQAMASVWTRRALLACLTG